MFRLALERSIFENKIKKFVDKMGVISIVGLSVYECLVDLKINIGNVLHLYLKSVCVCYCV